MPRKSLNVKADRLLNVGSAQRHLLTSAVKDKFGLSWQVVPTEWSKWYADETSEASQRTFEAILQMRKLDIEELKRAYEGEPSGAPR
jgi:predicted 3-demethylubiquinone-9 3-methyltransferase (glyoxalase superfamily)